jgi:hypothetical protein
MARGGRSRGKMKGETLFNRRPKAAGQSIFDDSGDTRVVRIGAVNGMVRIDYVNVRTGVEHHKVHPPAKAERIAQAVAMSPEKGRPVDMICAMMDAANLARRQNAEGENPAMVGMSFREMMDAGMKDEMRKIYSDVQEECRKDPLLAEEMRRIEAGQFMKFMFPDKSNV